MEINITQEDLDEIKNKYDDLTKWLVSNFCSFSACAFILETITNKVNEVEKQI